MARVRHSPASRRRKKKILKRAKGAFGLGSKVQRRAKENVQKGLVYAYRDRKVRKRSFRRLWTIRINAALRELGISYSKFMGGLKRLKITINRKMISELAINDKNALAALVEKIKAKS